MLDRPYKCPLCHSAFKGESGMKWHLVHRHEIPAAFDAIGKEYGARTTNLQMENDKLRKEVNQLQQRLDETNIALINKTNEKLAETTQLMQSNNLLRRAFLGTMLFMSRIDFDNWLCSILSLNKWYHYLEQVSFHQSTHLSGTS